MEGLISGILLNFILLIWRAKALVLCEKTCELKNPVSSSLEGEKRSFYIRMGKRKRYLRKKTFASKGSRSSKTYSYNTQHVPDKNLSYDKPYLNRFLFSQERHKRKR